MKKLFLVAAVLFSFAALAQKPEKQKKTDEEIIRDLNKEFCVKGGNDGHDKS